MSGLYTSLISDNKNVDLILSKLNLKVKDLDRFRDIDIPPYNRFRQLPLFTDTRFKDIDNCKNKDTVIVLTRTGGGNRKDYIKNWTDIKNNENYVCDYDADFDTTYAYIEFKIDKESLIELKKLDTNYEPDLKKLIDSSMNTARMLRFAIGGNQSESDLYEFSKKIALDLIKGK